MSFGFAVTGTPDQVRKQLAALDTTHWDEHALTVKSFLEHELPLPTETYETQEPHLVIEASGHHDARSSNLTVSVRTVFVPKTD